MKIRYIVEKLRSDGTPVMGTLNTMVRSYANDRNALRFMHRHLQADHFAPGQYQLSTWPVNAFEPQRVVGVLYKRA